MRLSIIIPVYNVEDYIEKCVLSLQQQDIPKEDYEIIIINDGSPDNSGEVILNLMKDFGNIVFIDQVNKGVSLARNAGIDKATGKYLLFIDPDDYVEDNTIARILNAADSMQVDISILGYKFLNLDHTLRNEILLAEFKGNVYSGIEAYYISRVNMVLDPDRSVAILFKRDFMNSNNLRYISDVPYLEDGEFVARVFCLAERCIFEGNSFYMRTTREGSATNSNLFFTEKSIKGFLKAAHNLKQFCEQQHLTNAQQVFINQPLTKFVLLAVDSSSNLFNWEKISYVKRQLALYKLTNLSVEGVLKPYNTYARLYNISPFLFIGYFWWNNFIIAFKIKLKLKPNN